MPNDPRVLSSSPPKESIIPAGNRAYDISSRQIGRGTYSTVLLATEKNSGEIVAVKTMDLRSFQNEFYSELTALKSLESEDVVRLRHWEVVRHTGLLYMDFIPDPTLYDYVRQSRCGLKEESALKIFWNVLSCVDSIHSSGWAHRDLKPENLMVNPTTFKITLIDFGLSIIIPESGLSDNFCGSPMYMPPEVLNREKHDPRVADIWSLGVILYHMLVGDSPWCGVESLDELLDIVIFEPVVKLPSFLSLDVRDLLSGIFIHDTTKRLSINGIKEKMGVLLSRYL